MVAVAEYFRSATAEQIEKVQEALHLRKEIDRVKERISKTGQRCRCPSGEPVLVDGEGVPPHWRRVECGLCNTSFGWIPPPENAKKRKKTHAKKTTDFCQCCLKDGVALTAHHVVEVQHGGGDEPENIWTVCESCHTIIHSLRNIGGAYS
jgi:hypothetical protein